VLEVASRSGRVTIAVGDVVKPVITKGSGTIDDEGIAHTPGHTSVEVTCPERTDVVIGAASGSVRCTGRLGRVAITTSSGRVEIEEAASIDVRTLSSSVTIGHCAGECAVVSESGSISVATTASLSATSSSGRIEVGETTDATVRSAAGSVRIGASGTGRVVVQTVSGSVTIDVPADALPAMRLVTRGTVRADPFSPSTIAPIGVIDIESVSGAITVRHT
jgi:DUF4097 and DUF4098 domain-containing protein YvlB